MFFVDLSVDAQEFLDKLDMHLRERIEKRLKNLKENPVPADARFIGRDKGDAVYRYRIGDYRALYKLKHAEKTVLITKIDKRPRVYD